MLNAQSSPKALYERLALMEKLNAELLGALILGESVISRYKYLFYDDDSCCTPLTHAESFVSDARTAIANAEKALEDRS